ncbi:MAG TPA: ABC transporter substrate-binding protein [Burkholderiales bacterium]|nr:ABC transporter substrate-binding protein [Burkholderiales bacterium]
MKRRQAILGIVLLAAGADRARAQPRKVPRVGVLHAGSSKEHASVQREPFERGLREHGWVPGSNIHIDYRYAEGNAARVPELASEIVKAGVDVIVARGNSAVDAARRATGTLPVVMSGWNGDPVADGVVKNLSRPGGNVTGVSTFAELDGKRLELLKEAFPATRRVAIIANPTFEAQRYEHHTKAIRASAQALKFEIQMFEARSREEFATVFSAIARAQADALLVRGDPQLLDPHRAELVAMAAKYRLPAMYWWRFFVEAGGLMSYGESIPGFHHRSASYVSRILKGANPGDLAIEQASKFDLVINLKTARALGIEIPKAMLLRADEVIQ